MSKLSHNKDQSNTSKTQRNNLIHRVENYLGKYIYMNCIMYWHDYLPVVTSSRQQLAPARPALTTQHWSPIADR